ncbi:MAG: type II secretion system protein [Verrucomicrobia bacterium]|nr:type II secretion system protein [Verrucomicrobiota bacterium]
MHNFFQRIRKLKANSFTLVELLVVISIIGLLAGLATPAIQKGLEKGKQTTDVSNGRQVAMILFAYANDESLGAGTFPTNGATSTDIFNALVTNGFVTTHKVLGGNGVPSPKTAGTNPVASESVYWAYTKGLAITDGGIPLLSTKNSIKLNNINSSAAVTPDMSSPWKDKGFVIVTADCASTWYSFTNGKVSGRWATLDASATNVSLLQP